MNLLHTRFSALLGAGLLLALAHGATLAADTGGASSLRGVYQQRLPDGSVLFTERPGPGSRIERQWRFPAEDPAEAAARRAELRAESEAVSLRLQRLIEQRERLDAELAIERMRQAGLRAWLESRADAPRAVVTPRGRRGDGRPFAP